MPDAFPESFDRYTDKEHPQDAGIKTFQQLLNHYGGWQGRRMSRKQRKAMAKYSEQEFGIKPLVRVTKHVSYQRTLKSGEVKTISYDWVRFRDVNTGKFGKY